MRHGDRISGQSMRRGHGNDALGMGVWLGNGVKDVACAWGSGTGQGEKHGMGMGWAWRLEGG